MKKNINRLKVKAITLIYNFLATQFISP